MQFNPSDPPDPNRVIVLEQIDQNTNTTTTYIGICSSYDSGGTWMFTGVGQNMPFYTLENSNLSPVESDPYIGLGPDVIAEMTWHYAVDDPIVFPLLKEIIPQVTGGYRSRRRRRQKRRRTRKYR